MTNKLQITRYLLAEDVDDNEVTDDAGNADSGDVDADGVVPHIRDWGEALPVRVDEYILPRIVQVGYVVMETCRSLHRRDFSCHRSHDALLKQFTP